ncbi:hypothetical protein BCV63_10985 [Cylindrospermopsis raciborskii CS-508]|nr:hypothetical protein BCV63_10985 [Cylindrospermopsis raciborskii CS-508]
MILTGSKFKLVLVCRITAFYGGLAMLNLFCIFILSYTNKATAMLFLGKQFTAIGNYAAVSG